MSLPASLDQEQLTPSDSTTLSPGAEDGIGRKPFCMKNIAIQLIFAKKLCCLLVKMFKLENNLINIFSTLLKLYHDGC